MSALHLFLFSFSCIRTDVLGRQHGSVGGGLVTVSLDLHTTSNTGDGFTAAVERKCVSQRNREIQEIVHFSGACQIGATKSACPI